MNRYTDVDEVLDQIRKKLGIKSLSYLSEAERQIVNAIQSAPSIDIVFCKECKHRVNDEEFQEKHICLLRRANGGKFCRDDDFCSYGSRSEKPNNSTTEDCSTVEDCSWK